jgi:hypothetical protein
MSICRLGMGIEALQASWMCPWPEYCHKSWYIREHQAGLQKSDGSSENWFSPQGRTAGYFSKRMILPPVSTLVSFSPSPQLPDPALDTQITSQAQLCFGFCLCFLPKYLNPLQLILNDWIVVKERNFLRKMAALIIWWCIWWSVL